ncbi:DNA alkylation repair protein [Bdellovibrio bacteriovorus]|uniref:DNA alkylation repair protein n=1 Tax=Bdellovibrio bacteriovorus TaxID=959 RepID=UPI0035A606F0
MKKKSGISQALSAVSQLQKDVQSHADASRAVVLQRFFKTGKGEYAEGDVFLGLTVPQSRKIAKKYASALSLKELDSLVKSANHEERLIALLILVSQFQEATEKEQTRIFKLYIKNSKYVNNWDLVDTSAPAIVGGYLLNRDRSVLRKLATSKNLWQRRIAMLATFHFVYNGESADTLKIAKLLLKDEHDLIHKAVGWMLREMGKRVSEEKLLKFLDQYAAKMPRTMLRYSLEKLPAETRRHYMNK